MCCAATVLPQPCPVCHPLTLLTSLISLRRQPLIITSVCCYAPPLQYTCIPAALQPRCPPLKVPTCRNPPTHHSACSNGELLVQSLHRSIQPPAVAAAAGQLRQLHFCGKRFLALHRDMRCCSHAPHPTGDRCAACCGADVCCRLFHLELLRCTAGGGGGVGRGQARRSGCGRSWDCSAGWCAWAALLA